MIHVHHLPKPEIGNFIEHVQNVIKYILCCTFNDTTDMTPNTDIFRDSVQLVAKELNWMIRIVYLRK